MAPITTSSTLGWVAAVIETESPSQPSPAVIHTMWMSLTAGGRCVTRPYGTVSAAMSFSSLEWRLKNADRSSVNAHKYESGQGGLNYGRGIRGRLLVDLRS